MSSEILVLSGTTKVPCKYGWLSPAGEAMR